MKRCIIIFFALLIYPFLSQLEALNRDYRFDCDEDNTCQHYYKPYCLYHTPGNSPEGFPSYLLHLIPATGPECCRCYDSSIYIGYLDIDFKKYRSHLKHQLEYSDDCYYCFCLWPEYSKEAAEISDIAYLLFRDLISTTALSSLIENESDQRELIGNSHWLLNKHGVTISFIAQQFRFSDYYRVCRDIENFAISKYEEREIAKIKDKLEDILEALYPKFFVLYGYCYKNHLYDDIAQEIRFMKLLVRDISGLDKTISLKYESPKMQNFQDISKLIVANLKTAKDPIDLDSKGVFSHSQIFGKNFAKSVTLNVSVPQAVHLSKGTSLFLQSDIFLEQGTLLNDLLLYKEAIHVLTQAIQLNPDNRDAYIERAMAYFETNQLSLALKDYESAKKLTIIPPFKLGICKALAAPMVAPMYIPENPIEFSKGLILGITEGAKISVVEFIPSVLGCCRGILNGLWAFTSSPNEVSQEMVNAAYAIGEFINEHSTEECLQCVIPELKELSLTWDKIDDHSRGEKIGYIIGKYGVDIFLPVGILKGVKKLRDLKRANTMLTLESCAISQAKQAKILEESIKRASLRAELLIESVKKGKILIKNSNVQYHIMQVKHAWNKILKLSGNVEEDFKKVLAFLEDKNIVNPKNLKNITALPKDAPFKNIHLLEYRATIEGYKIQLFFEKYLDTGELFLKNGWVITK